MPIQHHTDGFPLTELDSSRLNSLLGPAAGAVAWYGALAANPNATLLRQ